MFKVVVEGVEIQCENADDAIDLINKLRGSPVAHRENSREGNSFATGSRWTASRFQNFAALLRDKQKTFLQQLIDNPDGVTDIALRQSLNLNTNKGLGPILTAISRKAKKIGVEMKEVYTREDITHGTGEQVLEFKASPALIAISREGGGLR